MKKQLIFGSLLALSGMLNAQAVWTNGTAGSAYRTGNIGINNTAPAYALDVNTANDYDGIRINNTRTAGNTGLFLRNSLLSKEWQLWNLAQGSAWGQGSFCIYDGVSSAPQILIDNYHAGQIGNVGIGTASPAGKLDIFGTSNQLRLSYSSSVFSDFQTTSSGNLFINPIGGNVGIGTASPQYKLHVAGAVKATDLYLFDNSNNPLVNIGSDGAGNVAMSATGNGNLMINYYYGKNTYINTGSAGGQVRVGDFFNASKHVEIGNPTSPISNAPTNVALDMFVNDGKAIRVTTSWGPLSIFEGYNSTIAKTIFKVNGNGATQIGLPLDVTSPHYGGTTMLSVKGKIVAKEIVVTQLLWADYVFAKNYKLNNLDYLENYIKENKHLPNVPSAKEVEEKGVSLGEMSKIQMEKIEELSLYIIELNKKTEQLNLQIEEIKKSIKK